MCGFPIKLLIQKQNLMKKETQVVISDLRIVDEQLEVIEPSYFAYRNVKVSFYEMCLKINTSEQAWLFEES